MTEAPPQQPKTVFNIGYIIDVKKEQRGHMATQTATTAATNLAAATAKREFTAQEKMACSIDAMMNGGECEACQ